MTAAETGAAVEAAAEMRAAIEVIEESYEFMLAYAAQGRSRESEEEGVSKIRDYLGRLRDALDRMAEAAPAALPGGPDEAFRARFLDDLRVMRSVVGLLLARPSISSDMVDNTNGLIAVRSFLTDLFFIDQALLPPR